jgi:hypothetical protein
MKKQLNEELDRIKSIMGCCKGKINEDQENCVDPESPEGQKAIDRAVGYVKYEVDKLGLTNEDLAVESQETPEIVDAKNKLTEMVEPAVTDMDGPQLKELIMGVKRLIKNKKSGKTEEPQPTAVNEQIGSAAAILSQVEIFLLALPTGVFVAVAVWLLLRFVRCYIYKFVRNATGDFCRREIVDNPFNRVLQLVFLDFRNLFSGWKSGDQDNYLWGCERWHRR